MTNQDAMADPFTAILRDLMVARTSRTNAGGFDLPAGIRAAV